MFLGEEAYSLSFETHAMAGMLSHEKEPYRILATDINTQAIVSAYKEFILRTCKKFTSVCIE